MSRDKQPSWLRRFFTSPLFLVCSFLCLGFFIFSFLRSYYQDYHIRREIYALEKEVQSLEHKKLESLAMLDYVMSDSFVEEIAREELDYKRPGEGVLVVHSSDLYDETEVGIDSEKKRLSNPMKWWYYFTHKEL